MNVIVGESSIASSFDKKSFSESLGSGSGVDGLTMEVFQR